MCFILIPAALLVACETPPIHHPELDRRCDSLTGNERFIPVRRVEPRYPRHALQNRISGSVTMSFQLDALGKPYDVEVVESQPRGLFDEVVVEALEQWRYCAPSEPLTKPIKVRLDFAL